MPPLLSVTTEVALDCRPCDRRVDFHDASRGRACGRGIAGPVAVDCWACGRQIAGPVAVDCWACGRRIAGPVAVEGNVAGSQNCLSENGYPRRHIEMMAAPHAGFYYVRVVLGMHRETMDDNRLESKTLNTKNCPQTIS